MRRKTPQEKKALSYAKDRRNTYGENDKSSRKNIPLSRAKSHRLYRKKVNSVLYEILKSHTTEDIEIIENEVKSVSKNYWKKCPDEPLGEVVQRNLESRKLHAGKGKTLSKKTREIIESMKINVSQISEEVWIAKIEGYRNLITEGRTQNEAVGRIKILALVAIQNSLGLDRQILVNGKLIKPFLEKN